jgi:peptidoglycan/xylan/chitin deacetylase (PgdA/CDA1 family)
LLSGLLICITTANASAADCPGHPDALGTSRTLVVDPKAHPHIGTMQYRETLPLRDHEVVLTFDDGPLPHNSDQILAILAAQCIKATFFTVGSMAKEHPEGVRKLREAGHTVATHTQNHPLGFDKFPIERAGPEIDDGIASVTAALGEGGGLAPFFRAPGLRRSQPVEDHLASLGIMIWSADFPADDWRAISPTRVYELAIRRIEAKKKGILLLHDIQTRTVAALPRILHELKARGYRIVHVVPATPTLVATPWEAPPQWQMRPPSETVAISHWPRIPNFVFADAGTLPAPSLQDSGWRDGQLLRVAEPFDRSIRRTRGVPLPPQALWPRQSPQPTGNAETALPVPSPSIFEMHDEPSKIAPALAPSPSSRRAERAIPREASGLSSLAAVVPRLARPTVLQKPRVERPGQPGSSQLTARRPGLRPVQAAAR